MICKLLTVQYVRVKGLNIDYYESVKASYIIQMLQFKVLEENKLCHPYFQGLHKVLITIGLTWILCKILMNLDEQCYFT